ncbi:MAG: alpha/beta fold hydrolase [Clostridia bacterium]|nr:alpha/beta fold hydrolase [Clostridia bacterium]
MNLAIKSISVILSVLMAILPTLQAAPQPVPSTTAAENYKYTLEDMSVVYDEKDENGNYYPLVVVPGISHSITYVVDENYDYENAEDPSKPPIKQDAFGNDMTGSTIILDIPAIVLAAVTQFIVPLVLSVMTQSDAGLVDGIAKLADAAFSVQKTLPDGTFANNEIGLLEFNGSFADFATKDYENQSYMENQTEYLYKILPLRSVAEVIGEENLFFFTFSLFGDAMASADNLDKYIDMVLEKTGAKKVNLLPISLGGTIFTAYAEKYTDTDKVNAVVNVVPVLNGTQVVSDMYQRDFNLDGEYWYRDLFPIIIGEFTEYGSMIGSLVNLLIRALPADVNASMITSMYNVLLENLLINTPQMWAMVTREDYPELAEKYLGDAEHAPIRAMTDAFYRAQMNLEDNIRTMVDNGIEINIISGYSLHTGEARYNFFQLMGDSFEVNGDGIIQVESTTLGATAALPGEQLPADYKQAIDSEYSYISPDRELDASTGVLPDNTWYFYNMNHEDTANNAPVINLALALLYSDEVDDVHTNPEKFPQFNGNSDNWFIRRWRYNDLKKIYQKYLDGEIEMSAEDAKECEALLYECERVMRATIADDAFCKETTLRVNIMCNKYSGLSDEDIYILTQKQMNELDPTVKAIETIIKITDQSLCGIFGTKAYSQFWMAMFE